MPPFLVNLADTPTRRIGLRTPTRGVRAPAEEDTWMDDVLAIALTLPSGAVFSTRLLRSCWACRFTRSYIPLRRFT